MRSVISAKACLRCGVVASWSLATVMLSTGIAAGGTNGNVDRPVEAGSVTITQPGNPARPLTSGDSNTVFSLTVPAGASCPGDTFYEDWRVQSFIVPATDDPGGLRYGVIWPEGDGRRSLYSESTMPYSHVITGRSDGPGEPGPIVQPGPMTFAVYEAGLFRSGNYRIGLACTKHRETAAFWDAEIIIADAPEVEPGGFTWSVVADDAVSAPARSDSSGSGWIAALAGATAVGAAVFITRHRRSSRTHITPQESS